jgi:hypothetical protein
VGLFSHRPSQRQGENADHQNTLIGGATMAALALTSVPSVCSIDSTTPSSKVMVIVPTETFT